MIEIQETGSYFDTDSEGYLVNPASPDKIQEEWRPLVDAVVASYQNIFGDKLVSVYVRGSVGKGEAIQHISDVDSFAYVDIEQNQIDRKALQQEAVCLGREFSFAQNIEFEADAIHFSQEDQFLIAQAALVYGKDLQTEKFKVGKDIIRHAKNPKQVRARLERLLAKEDSTENIQASCAWLCKQILRSGIELCFERSGKYSRDLYRCWETFSQYYPDKSDEMREVLYLALNPITDTQRIIDLEEKWTQWIIAEKQHLGY